MQKRNLFKKAISSVLASALVIGSIFTTSLTAQAVGTDASDGSSGGNHAWTEGKGDWSTYVNNSTIYRLYPILLEDDLDSYPEGSSVTLSYENQYYRYRDCALYVTEKERDRSARHFVTSHSTSSHSIDAQILNSDGSFDFSAIGLNLNLPRHSFDIGGNFYTSFSDELNSKIITEGDNANILDIFGNYIAQMDSRYGSLSASGQSRLNELKSLSGYGTDSWTTDSRRYGLVIELCSLGIEDSTNKQYVFSYGDLIRSGLHSDVYYVYCNFKEAKDAGALLTWSAKYNESNISILPEEVLGEAVYFMVNDPKTSKATYTQSLNIALSLNEEMKANTNSNSITKAYGVSTSDKNPDVSLGDNAYKNVLADAYSNSTPNTSLTLSNNTVLNSADKTATLNALLNKSDYNGLSLVGYDTLSIPISGEYSLSDLGSADIASALSNVSVRTSVNAVPAGFGNKFSLVYSVGKNTVKRSVASKIATINGVSSVNANSSKKAVGTVSNLADLQSSTLLSGKIEGRPSSLGVSEASGTIYASISYLAKDKDVTNKNAQVYVNANANVENMKNVESTSHSATSTNTWGIESKAKTYTYTIAWKSSDYDLTDGKALTEAMLASLGETYMLRGYQGISTLSKAFMNVTDKSALGVKYNTGSSVEVGATSDADGNIVGINTLTILVSQELPLNVSSTDYVDSNELNFIYADLRGYKSSISSIAPMSAYISDIVYNYSVLDENAGDLISFKGSDVHYYYEPTGLFGVFSQTVKSFGDVSYPSYAYNLSRGLWGDSLVASNYRGMSANDETVKNDIINNLGLSVGAVGNNSSVTAGENVDGTVDTKKNDTYKFTASIDRKWYTTEYDANGNPYQEEHTETVNEVNKYSITHSLNKYTCASLDITLNSGAGKAGFNIQNAAGINNKVTMVTQSANILTMYPEVAYKYYLASNNNNGVLGGVKPLTVYVMGEKARMMNPSSIRGIDMDFVYGTNVASGDIVSDGAGVGSEASSMSDGKQVLTSGTNITMSAEHNVDYRLISYSLDLVDSYSGVSVRNEFSSSNVDYKPAEEHEAYVKNFIDNVKVDTYMTIGTKEYLMQTSNTEPVVKSATADTFISITFADGVIATDSKNSIINDMATEYNITVAEATQMFESSGFEAQLQAMLESNTDNFNGSKNKWYDEESVTICVRKYVTVVDLKQTLVQDKIDYSAVGVTDSRNSNGSVSNRAVDGLFTMSVYLPERFNECSLVNANKLYEKQEIQGTEFKVSSASTSDWIK